MTAAAAAFWLSPSQSPRAREEARYNLHMTSLPPIEPDLIAAYQARVVAQAADFLVTLLAAGPRSPQEVGAAADAAF
jgi:hypothetical protein